MNVFPGATNVYTLRAAAILKTLSWNWKIKMINQKQWFRQYLADHTLITFSRTAKKMPCFYVQY